MNYASLTRRGIASVVDICIFFTIEYLILYPIYGSDVFLSPDFFIDEFHFIITWIIPLIVTILFWRKFGATPGKIALSIKIVDKDTQEFPSLAQSIKRYFGYCLMFLSLGLSIMWMLKNKSNQTFHDILSNTVVVKGNEVTEFKEPIFKYIGNSITCFFVVLASLTPAPYIAEHFGYIPSTVVTAGNELPEKAIETLIENKIINRGENIALFYSNGVFSYLEDGNLITDKRVISYWEENSKIEIVSINLDDIKQVEVANSESIFEDSIIYVYSNSESMTLYANTYKSRDLAFIKLLNKYVKKIDDIPS